MPFGISEIFRNTFIKLTFKKKVTMQWGSEYWMPNIQIDLNTQHFSVQNLNGNCRLINRKYSNTGS